MNHPNEPNFDDYPNFFHSEFRCKGEGCCGGQARMKPEFMARLQDLRDAFKRPLAITSGYRCPAHNDSVSSTGTHGPHTTGAAVDIGIDRADALELLQLITIMGFNGLGVKQKGSGRFLHIDDREKPAFWSY